MTSQGVGCSPCVSITGGPGHTIPNSFSGAIFFVGGSGVSYGLAAVQELLKQAQAGMSTVRTIDLVWSVHHPGAISNLRSLAATKEKMSVYML